jgi:ATP-binding cassette, subfamily B, bacterial
MSKLKKIKFGNIIGENKGKIITVFFLITIFALFEAAVPYSLSFIIDNAILEKNGRLLTIILMILGIGAVIVASFQVLRDYLYLDVCSKSLSKIRANTYEHILHLSMGFYSKTQPGEVISRFSTDLAAVEQGLVIAPNYFLVPLINIVISCILLFSLDIRLAIISLLVFPAVLIGPYVLSPRATKAGYLRKKTEASTISEVQVTVSSQPVIKALNLQKLSTYYFNKSNNRFYKSMLHSLFTSALVDRSGIVAVMILQVIVLAVGSYMTIYGVLAVGQLVAFQGLFLGLSYSLIMTSSFIPLIIQTKVGINRINKLLDEKIQVKDETTAKALPEFNDKIEFENVSFGYKNDEKNLQGLSITIPKNKSVAFVGPSGCGKSTILNLIMRFYEPNTGRVKFDGYDVKKATQASLRKQLGIVLQDNILFNISIMDNILIADLNATKEEIYKAAKMAEIHDFITSLPNGYRTLAGERGNMLSGGQRQRIAIARALLSGGNILILDEATSALDPVSETVINKTISKISKNGKTVISVTHRLNSVVNTDHIFVMNKGKVIEQGNHNQLLKLNGLYKNLWNLQNT